MKRDMAIMRMVDAIVAVVIVVVLYSLLSSGTLVSLGRLATDWYSQRVDGLFNISVVDTSVQLPQLDRESLPIASALESRETTSPGTGTVTGTGTGTDTVRPEETALSHT